jgi:hypothetical protein
MTERPSPFKVTSSTLYKCPTNDYIQLHNSLSFPKLAATFSHSLLSEHQMSNPIAYSSNSAVKYSSAAWCRRGFSSCVFLSGTSRIFLYRKSVIVGLNRFEVWQLNLEVHRS